MSVESVEQIAEVVLYEGYLLFPYRHSSVKNQQRWTFGGVYPRGFSEAAQSQDPWQMQTQCLLEAAPETPLEITVRFLQVVDAGDHEEALDRRVQVTLQPAQQHGGANVAIPAGVDGAARWEALSGRVEVSSRQLGAMLWQVTVGISNTTPCASTERPAALHRAFISTHTILCAPGGAFISLLEPPPHLAEATAACCNLHTWPVLAGDPPDRQVMLSSPIILYDYPQVAPQSHGNFYDTTEIDELLTLSVLALSDDEKQEMRQADARSRAILERTEALTPEQVLALHGVSRTLP
ncbi:MAG: hypothetical protein ACRDGF_05450 [Chloroflexota bacterium]